jgi:hypothetical protein
MAPDPRCRIPSQLEVRNGVTHHHPQHAQAVVCSLRRHPCEQFCVPLAHVLDTNLVQEEIAKGRENMHVKDVGVLVLS